MERNMLSKEIIDKYHIVKKLATGGMGELYLAEYYGIKDFKRLIVVKRLHSEFKENLLYKELFFQEGILSGKFDHPNIVHVYDTNEDEVGPYIIMEYILGKDLMSIVRTSLNNKSFIPLNHAINIIIQIAEGLAYVHSLKDEKGKSLEMIHRDVTPSNILVTLHGFAKLVDFGVAEVKGKKNEILEGIIPGKINYMAPEILKGDEVDQRSDIFSLGVILYELTVGKRLFRGKPEDVKEKILNNSIELPTSVNSGFDPTLERIVLKALDKNPMYRYAFAEELISDLENYALQNNLLLSRLELAQYIRSLFKVKPLHYKIQNIPKDIEIDLDLDSGFFDGDWQYDAFGAELPEELLVNLDDDTYFEIMAKPGKTKEFIENRNITDKNTIEHSNKSVDSTNNSDQSKTTENTKNPSIQIQNSAHPQYNTTSDEIKNTRSTKNDDDINIEVLQSSDETNEEVLSKHTAFFVLVLVVMALLLIYFVLKN